MKWLNSLYVVTLTLTHALIYSQCFFWHLGVKRQQSYNHHHGWQLDFSGRRVEWQSMEMRMYRRLNKTFALLTYLSSSLYRFSNPVTLMVRIQVIPTHFLVPTAVQVKLERVSVKGTYIPLIWCHSGSKGNRASSVKMSSSSAVLPSAPLPSQSTKVVKNQIVQKIRSILLARVSKKKGLTVLWE